MGEACGMYGGEEKCLEAFGGKTSTKEAAWKT
jgi:hypothetical protein